MRRPRLTVLQLMLIVGLVAVGLEAVRLARLSMRHASRADEHRREALRYRAELANVEAAKTVTFLGSDSKDFVINYLSCNYDYHYHLYSNYTKALYTPWRAVPPDPSAPDLFPPIPMIPPLDLPPLPFLSEADLGPPP